MTRSERARCGKASIPCSALSGKILDIICIRTKALRGQAWIVFSDPSAAAASLRQMQGFPFMTNQMRLQFSRKPSKKAIQTLGEAGRLAAAANSQALAAAASAAVAHGGASAASPVLFVGGFPRSVRPTCSLPCSRSMDRRVPLLVTRRVLSRSVLQTQRGQRQAFQNLQGFHAWHPRTSFSYHTRPQPSPRPRVAVQPASRVSSSQRTFQGLPAPSASHLQATTEGATKEEPASRPAPGQHGGIAAKATRRPLFFASPWRVGCSLSGSSGCRFFSGCRKGLRSCSELRLVLGLSAFGALWRRRLPALLGGAVASRVVAVGPVVGVCVVTCLERRGQGRYPRKPGSGCELLHRLWRRRALSTGQEICNEPHVHDRVSAHSEEVFVRGTYAPHSSRVPGLHCCQERHAV